MTAARDPLTTRVHGAVAAADRMAPPPDRAEQPAGPANAVDAIPVALSLSGPDRAAIRRWIEGVAGWQPVEAEAAGLVPPVLAVVDATGPPPPPGLPTVLLVRPEDDPLTVARTAARVRPGAVVRWPADRDTLLQVAGAVIGAGGVSADEVAHLRVAGASGGVGTTTVALALGGLVAWRARDVLVVSHGAVPSPVERMLTAEALSGAGAWHAATPARGLPGLRVVRAPGPVGEGRVDPGPASLVVRDLGVDEECDILVVRRDAAGLAALERSAAAVVVVVDAGVASPGAVTAASRSRRVVVVPASVRVARAALAGRVPAGLPGAWLRALAPALEGARF